MYTVAVFSISYRRKRTEETIGYLRALVEELNNDGIDLNIKFENGVEVDRSYYHFMLDIILFTKLHPLITNEVDADAVYYTNYYIKNGTIIERAMDKRRTKIIKTLVERVGAIPDVWLKVVNMPQIWVLEDHVIAQRLDENGRSGGGYTIGFGIPDSIAFISFSNQLEKKLVYHEFLHFFELSEGYDMKTKKTLCDNNCWMQSTAVRGKGLCPAHKEELKQKLDQNVLSSSQRAYSIERA